MQQFKIKDNCFITKGFSNCKKTIERFRSHQNTDYLIHFTSLSSTRHVGYLLCDQSTEYNKENQICLRAIFSSVLYLSKQNIAILGSKENRVNFIELLLELRSNEIPELKSILNKYADPSTRKQHIGYEHIPTK